MKFNGGDGGRINHIQKDKLTAFIGSLYEIDSDGAVRKHIYAGANRICSINSTNSSNSINYYHSDHLGSTSLVTNSKGDVIRKYEYKPFGELFSEDVLDPSSDIPNFLYTGKRLDKDTGLYYYGARYYDPKLGRFTSPDSIVQAPSDPQSLNRYSYCRNNPINLTDPTGHSWFKKNWQTIVSVVTTVVSILVPPLSLAMWAVNTAISAYTSIQTGNILGMAGGIIGGAVFGAIGKSFALGIAGNMSEAFANSFAGGALVGAVEFGIGGFGAGFGGGLASGSGFSDALRFGMQGAAIGAVTGAAIQGSYMAGWQDGMHGLSKAEIAAAQAKGLPIGPNSGAINSSGSTNTNTEAKTQDSLTTSYSSKKGERLGGRPGGRQGGGKDPGKQPKPGPDKPLPPPKPGKPEPPHPPDIQDWIDVNRGHVPGPDWDWWGEPVPGM